MKRIVSVDLFRLLAILAIIALHTKPFDARPDTDYQTLEILINQLARFAVPFFFIMSGYFWGRKVREGIDPFPLSTKYIKRIFFIFVGWNLIYLLPTNFGTITVHGLLGPVKVVWWHLQELFSNPLLLILEGTKEHLWFLVSLMIAIAISAVFVKRQWKSVLLVFSILLYVLGVLAKSYADTPVGITIGIDSRYGPFFSTCLFVIGYLLSGQSPNSRWLIYGAIILLFSTLAHFTEIYFLWKWFGTSLTIHEYVFSTAFMGMGMAMMALSNHPILQNSYYGDLGKKTLGIYAIHAIYVDMFQVLDWQIHSVLWEIGYLIMVCVLSIISVNLMAKYKYTQKLVM